MTTYCDFCLLPIREDIPTKYLHIKELTWLVEKEVMIVNNNIIHNCTEGYDTKESCFLHKKCYNEILLYYIAHRTCPHTTDSLPSGFIYKNLMNSKKKLRIKHNRRTYHISELFLQFDIKNDKIGKEIKFSEYTNQIIEFDFNGLLFLLYDPFNKENILQNKRIKNLISNFFSS